MSLTATLDNPIDLDPKVPLSSTSKKMFSLSCKGLGLPRGRVTLEEEEEDRGGEERKWWWGATTTTTTTITSTKIPL